MKTITIILLMILSLSSNAQTTEIIRLDYPTNVNTVIIAPNQVNLIPLLPLNLNNTPNNNILFTQETCKNNLFNE